MPHTEIHWHNAALEEIMAPTSQLLLLSPKEALRLSGDIEYR